MTPSDKQHTRTEQRPSPEPTPSYWVPRYQQWMTLNELEYTKQVEARR